MDAQHGNDIRHAMHRGRLAVERYFDEMTAALGEPAWSETDATSRLLLAAHPQIRFIPFNQSQEGGSPTHTGVGSDWMWWWIGPTGACFGILIQAKNLKRTPTGWSVDLHYRQERQINDLLAAADILGLPAAYTLYCGPPSYRQDLTCGPSHTPAIEDLCHRSGVCGLPALAAKDLIQLSAFDNTGRAATDAYEWATPLEDFVDARHGPHQVIDLNFSIANADLRSFLLAPQQLPLSIAKNIFRTVSRLRQVKAWAPPSVPRSVRVDRPLFADDPSGRGHVGVPYRDHVLRGIRRQPPPYLARISDGGEPSSWLPNQVAGVVIAYVS